MAWQIENLAVPYSETDLTDWLVELRLVMPGWDLRKVAPLFDRAGAFTIPWADAGRIADALADAACSALIHPSAVRMTEDIAAAARQAARQRKPWRWT
jgi:hypothetical protein